MSISRAIKLAADTGKITLGYNSTVKSLKFKSTKLVILASNCPKSLREDIERYARISSVPVLHLDKTRLELGPLCGKPFGVSVLGVIDPGESNILNLSREAVEWEK
ncbi:MAG: 50S ribosomal protein L30e [Candidatus Hydrothermarchaeota archaeon]